MKKRVLGFLLIFCLVFSMLAACQKQPEETAPQVTDGTETAAPQVTDGAETTAPPEEQDSSENPSQNEPDSLAETQPEEAAYRFADREEAAQLLLEERDYYENLSQNDLNYRLQKLDATLEELEAYTTTQTLDYTEEEKALIEETMRFILAQCETRGYHLPALENIVFAKTTMCEESNAGAYTHGTRIFLGEAVLNYGLSDDASGQSYFRYILAHELFHCLTRNNPEFRKQMYALLGFTVVDEDFVFPKEIKDRIISNPDVEHHNSYAAFEINGELKNCVVVFTTKPFAQPGDSFFDEMQTGLIPIDDLSVMYLSDDASNFWDVFGKNTGYVIDPEETLADNFGYTIVYGLDYEWPTPELIEAIDAYLKSR